MSKAKRKILSHEKLSLTFVEQGAFLAVREMLKQGLVVHNPDATVESFEPNEHAFNMNYACNVEHCGSVGCIGGYVALVMGLNKNDAEAYVHGTHEHFANPDAKHALFFPYDKSEYDWDKISAKQAIKAIDNFLAGRQHPWRGI